MMLGTDAFNRMGYTPSEWQMRYHALPHREALGAGAAGPGKTTALIQEPTFQIVAAHVRCQEYELKKKNKPWENEYLKDFPVPWGRSSGRALYLRRASTMLTQIIDRADALFRQLDPGLKWSEKKMEFTFSSGYKYKFGHCKDLNDYKQYYSDEFTIVMFDEGTQFEEKQYQEISNRVRSVDPVFKHMLKVRMMSNPIPTHDGMAGLKLSNPNWVRDYFVDPHPDGNVSIVREIKLKSGSVVKRRRIYLPARLSDNPDPEFVEEYEATLKANNPAHLVRALFDGDWYSSAGSFFECWNAEIHVVKPFDIPADWPRWRAMDWGFKTPGCIGWFAMDEDGNVILEREYTFIKKMAGEVADRVKEIEMDLGVWAHRSSLITGVADTQLWEQRGDGAKTKASIFSEKGIPWGFANKKSRAANAEKVTGRLMDDCGGTARPGLVVFNSCVMTIKTLPTIQTNPDNIEEPQKGGQDHWYDMVSYGVAYASQGAKGIPKRRRIKEPWEMDDEKRPRRKVRGPLGY